MKPSFLIVNSPFNNEWNKELIGFVFAVPPSYCQVRPVLAPYDFFNYLEFKIARN